MHPRRHADEIEKLCRLLAAAPLVVGENRAVHHILPGRDAVMDMKSRDHVLKHAELLEQADLLERSRNAEPHAPVRGHSRQIAALERQRPGIGLIDTADQIEQRRFPRPVRPDDRENRAGRNVERNVRHRFHAAEILVQPLRLQQRLHRRDCCGCDAHVERLRPSFSATTRAACASPPGMKSTTKVSAAP